MSQKQNRLNSNIIGSGEKLASVLKKAAKIVSTDCTVLVTGETGTGKELIARALHNGSPRTSKKFVAINCAAISKDLLESELFGHVQGAFTTAVRSREGSFQAADGGTLFLDEIGEMPLELQGKILRALQFKEFTPVGDTRLRRVDVRVIAATNVNLEQKVADGTFRSDLYYRLNVVKLEMPPLRDRKEDLGVLVAHFVKKASHRYNREPLPVNIDAMKYLGTYNWPGNVRELENAIEHAVLMSEGSELCRDDFPPMDTMNANDVDDFVRPLTDEGIDLSAALRKIEAHYIDEALTLTVGNKNKAASLLGLNRTTLVEKLKRGVLEAV